MSSPDPLIRFFVLYKGKTEQHMRDSSIQNERNRIRVRLKYKREVKKIGNCPQLRKNS